MLVAISSPELCILPCNAAPPSHSTHLRPSLWHCQSNVAHQTNHACRFVDAESCEDGKKRLFRVEVTSRKPPTVTAGVISAFWTRIKLWRALDKVYFCPDLNGVAPWRRQNVKVVRGEEKKGARVTVGRRGCVEMVGCFSFAEPVLGWRACGLSERPVKDFQVHLTQNFDWCGKTFYSCFPNRALQPILVQLPRIRIRQQLSALATQKEQPSFKCRCRIFRLLGSWLFSWFAQRLIFNKTMRCHSLDDASRIQCQG